MNKTATYRPWRLFVLLSALVPIIAVLHSLRTDGSVVGDDPACDAQAGVDANAPLLIIDPARRQMELQVADRTVWHAEYSTDGASGANAAEFFANLSPTGNRGPVFIESCHLYTGRGQYTARELTVVAEEIHVPPEMLQRIYPGRLAVVFSDGSVLEIITGIDASPLSRWDNSCFDIMRFIDAPWGERCLHVTMDSAAALTLYHLAQVQVRTTPRACRAGLRGPDLQKRFSKK